MNESKMGIPSLEYLNGAFTSIERREKAVLSSVGRPQRHLYHNVAATS